MQPSIEHVVYPQNASFACIRFAGPAFDCPYHVHDEVELLLIERSHGRRLVGDHVGRFAPGEVYLFGPGLPHMFYNDEPAGDDEARSCYVQFRTDCLGAAFFERSETRRLRDLLQSSSRGLVWNQDGAGIASQLATMPDLDGWNRTLTLLQMLGELHSHLDEATILASPGYARAAGSPTSHKSDRLSRAIDYIHRNLVEHVSLAGAARAAGLSPQAFSRFFRRHTGLRFIDFVIDLRISEASRLLLETDRSVSDIAMAVGFNNLSNFNRHFLRRKGMPPLRLRALR